MLVGAGFEVQVLELAVEVVNGADVVAVGVDRGVSGAPVIRTPP